MSSVLIFDHGVFCPLAEKLARTGEFDRVGYFRPWQNTAPTGFELMTGYGLDGVERIKFFWKVFDQFDLIVFPECFDSDKQTYLRGIGKHVWGSGEGAELELLRWKTHERIVAMGLPYPDCRKVNGLDELRSFLQDHENVWVKLSTLRGLDETWFSKNYRLSIPKLAEIESHYGPIAQIGEFIVEADIPDADEIGYGGFCIDGQFPRNGIFGAEIKDDCYACERIDYDDLPEEVKAVNAGLSPVLKDLKYRNFIGTEIRNDKLIDVTARHSSPEGETYCEMVDNLPEIMKAGAEGTLVEPEIGHGYGCQIMLRTPWSKEHWTAVYYPEELRPWVKLYDHCRVKGVDYVSPQSVHAPIGSVVATADTMDEAKAICRQRVSQVEALQLKTGEKMIEEAIEEVNAND